MPIGIRPTNDFAFKKTFGSPENKLALISLLNAILDLPSLILDVTIENPYNLQDFHDDKLSILDVKATDALGSIYDIEMQLTIFQGLVQRIVFYGCEIYAGQLRSGEDYANLKPAFSICLIDGILWTDSKKVHHKFQFTDGESNRTLAGTLEIHTLELGRYNRTESELAKATLLDCWLYWLLHAHEYESDELLRLFPQDAICMATKTINRIAQKTEDKNMYDAREKAIRDQQWALNSSFREGKLEGKLEGKIEGKIEGKLEGEIRLIQTLQEILEESVEPATKFQAMSSDELQAITAELRARIAKRR